MGKIGVEAARAAMVNVGVVEESDNRGKWVEMYQSAVGIPPGSPWCAAFVRFRFERAANELGLALPSDFPDSGWVPSYVAWARHNALWFPVGLAKENPSLIGPGDLACFWFPAKDRHAHIGIVVDKPTATGVVTVEGNTGPDRADAVQRDGDGVYRKRRAWGSLGVRGGFIKIDF